MIATVRFHADQRRQAADLIIQRTSTGPRLWDSAASRPWLEGPVDPLEEGLVGVAISVRRSDGSWEIDTFLLSCRVLRRGVETAFLAAVVDDLHTRSREAVTGIYIPSAKNAQVAEFFSDHGFAPVGDGKFVLAACDGVAVPSHIELVVDA